MAVASVFQVGKTALITGGASGIGLALVKKCCGYGMKVAVVDSNKEYLELAKDKFGERIRLFNMDVSQIDEWANLRAVVEKDFGHIDLLALNAGIASKGTWTDADYFHKVLDANFFGVVNGIATFLPSIKASASALNPAAIVITGSKQGITNPPGNPAYNASKAAVKSLAEGLSWELRPTRENPEKKISVHLLVPGWTYTGLSGATPSSNEGKPDGAWSGEQVVDYLEKKMAKGLFYIICPDNDVTEAADAARIRWSTEDIVQGRLPLTRWREEYKEEAAEWLNRSQS